VGRYLKLSLICFLAQASLVFGTGEALAQNGAAPGADVIETVRQVSTKLGSFEGDVTQLRAALKVLEQAAARFKEPPLDPDPLISQLIKWAQDQKAAGKQKEASDKLGSLVAAERTLLTSSELLMRDVGQLKISLGLQLNDAEKQRFVDNSKATLDDFESKIIQWSKDKAGEVKRLTDLVADKVLAAPLSDAEKGAIDKSLSGFGQTLDTYVKERSPRVHVVEAWYGDPSTGRVCDATAAFKGACEAQRQCPPEPKSGTTPVLSIKGADLCGFEPAPLAPAGASSAIVYYRCAGFGLSTAHDIKDERVASKKRGRKKLEKRLPDEPLRAVLRGKQKIVCAPSRES
jgi:hypothetical protein